MTKLIENTVIAGQDGTPVALAAGDDVPEWAADQIGAHLLDIDEDEDTGPVPYAKRKLADLKAEVDQRNADRDPEGEGYIRSEKQTIAALAEALEADDARQAAANAGGEGGSQQ